MRETSWNPPEDWPAEGRLYYRQFEAQLEKEQVRPRKYLSLLLPYFRLQARRGRDFRDFDRPFLDRYLGIVNASRKKRFLVALSRWRRFLKERNVPLSPPEPGLPGGSGQGLRREWRLDLKAPLAWPARAQELYGQFVTQLRQRRRTSREALRSLYRFFREQARQGFSFREFPVALLQDYLARIGDGACCQLVSALAIWMRFLYTRKELLLPLHEELRPYRRWRRGRRVLLSFEEVLRVLSLPLLTSAEGLRDRALFEVAYACGMRTGELMALELGDVDLGTGLVCVRQSKNDEQRNLPLTRWALFSVRRYLEQGRPQLTSLLSSNALWLNHRGRPLNRHRLSEHILKVYQPRKTLGFPFTLYQLRHACATHLLRGGAPLRHVQELLGHQDLNSTAIYTHLRPEQLRQVHQRFHPRNLPGFGAGDSK